MRSIMGGITATAAGFSVAAAPAAGVAITLVANPAPAPTPQAGQIHNNAVPVQISSGASGTFPANNITVVGTDRRGHAQTEIIAAPTSASTTTTGHLLFNTIISATPSATGTGTLSLGWAGSNYGPWLITAFHLASAVLVSPNNGTLPTFGVMTTDMNLLDPTFFLPQGQGGTPSGDMNQDGAFGITNSGQGDGPYIATNPWPLVPAGMQAACPQLLSTVNCMPEDDGTYSGMIFAPTTFTASTVGATQTTQQARLDPVSVFAWRVQVASLNLAQLDVNMLRALVS
jgi:hypothetical protein